MVNRQTNANKETGTLAEDYVADLLGGERTPNEWFDVETPGGHVVEVKSTQEKLSSGRRGRFRLWEDQHDKMTDVEGSYVFLVDGMDPVELSASEVTEVITENGLSWTSGGSHPMESRQLKLVWTHVMNLP